MSLGMILTGTACLCGGAVVASALSAFIIGLGIIPRYAGITHTGRHILLYEDFLILGCIIGNLISVYRIQIPCGTAGAGATGLFFGIFFFFWIIALGEVVNAFAIAARRMGLKQGAGIIILSIAIGKTLGCLLQLCA